MVFGWSWCDISRLVMFSVSSNVDVGLGMVVMGGLLVLRLLLEMLMLFRLM